MEEVECVRGPKKACAYACMRGRGGAGRGAGLWASALALSVSGGPYSILCYTTHSTTHPIYIYIYTTHPIFSFFP